MTKDVQVFTDLLRKRAGASRSWGDAFPLEDLTTNLTINISRFVQIRNIVTVWKWYSPWRLSAIARSGRVMQDESLPFIERRLRENKTKSSGKTVIGLVLKLIITSAADEEKVLPVTDQSFVDTVISQLKLFMLASHETTATALCWVIHCAAKNPDVARKLRA
ncbi:hypothetical protein LZ32DRAFT_659228 [Colletotrichum eremochloae]|nr:hypothetical protein LZ32DRAFT_659228 [Colletotrichum eremochloae]